jgi:hypothetical protein
MMNGYFRQIICIANAAVLFTGWAYTAEAQPSLPGVPADLQSTIKQINDSWQPSDVRQQRWRAIESARQSLDGMQDPNVVVVIDKNSIMKHLNSKISGALNAAPGVVITNPTLTFKEQGIDVFLEISANVGSVSIGGTAEGTVLAAVAGSSLHFLPALSKITIARLDFCGQPINPTIISIINASPCGCSFKD